MGSNQPVSLKLKQNLNWDSSIYKFNLKSLLKLSNQEKLMTKIIKHYFQSLLISKPIFHHYVEELSIIIYCYAKAKTRPKNEDRRFRNKLRGGAPEARLEEGNQYQSVGAEKRIMTPGGPGGLNEFDRTGLPWEINRLKKLESILTLIHGKKVKIKLIKLKSPIFNSSVLAQYLSINSMRYSINVLWRILFKKIKLASLKEYNTPITFNWNNLIKNGAALVFNQFYSYVTGIKLKISGRFSKRKGASRTKVKNYSIGSFKFNSASSLIDYSLIERKGKNGSQSIKVYISSRIFCAA